MTTSWTRVRLQLSPWKVVINIISAHHIVRRKLPEISLLSQCPNTHSLSSFLKDVSMVVSSTIDFIRSIQFVRGRFFPFSVSDHKVTFGECDTTLLFYQLNTTATLIQV